MNRTIGIICDANSVYIKRYVEFFILPYSKKVILFSEKNDRYSSFYKKENIKVVIYEQKTNWIDNYYVQKIMNTILLIKKLKEEKIDYIIMHYVHIYVLLLFKLLRINKKLILSYWGSDIKRVNTILLRFVKSVVYNSNFIVVETKSMKDYVIKIYGSVLANRISIINFANDNLPEIDKIITNKQKMTGGGYSITIGYNADPSQQHLKIIEELKKIPTALLEQILIRVPCTYPDNKDEYISKIKNVLDDAGLRYEIYRKFMNKAEIAQLCISSNFFINAQVTDSLSNSMIEFIYAGSKVIVGSWLDYDFLYDNNINVVSFLDFKEIPNIIIESIENGIVLDYNINEVKKIIDEEFGIRTFFSKWKNIVDKFINV